MKFFALGDGCGWGCAMSLTRVPDELGRDSHLRLGADVELLVRLLFGGGVCDSRWRCCVDGYPMGARRGAMLAVLMSQPDSCNVGG